MQPTKEISLKQLLKKTLETTNRNPDVTEEKLRKRNKEN